MAVLKIVANIETGDETTTGVNLFFKIYNSGTLYLTTGTSVTDSNVALVGDVVTISNIARTNDTAYVITIAQVDEAHNESIISNAINITSDGGASDMYATGMYAAGMYA